MEQERLFESAPAIEVGSLYYDRDERRPRWVRVEAIEGEYAICRSQSHRQSTIRVDRLASGRFGGVAPARVNVAAPLANLALPVEAAPKPGPKPGLLSRLLARLRG